MTAVAQQPAAVGEGRRAAADAADLSAAACKAVALLVLEGVEAADAGATAPADGDAADGAAASPSAAAVRELSFATLIAAATATVRSGASWRVRA